MINKLLAPLCYLLRLLDHLSDGAVDEAISHFDGRRTGGR